MFADVNLSTQMRNEFKRDTEGGIIDGVDFNVKVISMGPWPDQYGPLCKIPATLKACEDYFKDWYLSKKFTGQLRKLQYLYQFGKCIVATIGAKKPFQLETTIF